MLEGVTYRPAAPDEMSLVLDNWVRSYRTSDWAGVVPNHLVWSTLRELIGGLIARGAKILVAEFEGRVLGWLCYEQKGSDTILHMSYTKDPFRRRGVGKALVCEAISGRRGTVFYTHRTRASKYVVPSNAVFCPEIARRRDL